MSLALAMLLSVTHAIAQPGPITLENSQCRVEIDARTGDLQAIRPGPESLCGPWFEVVEEDRTGLQPWETWERGEETVFAGGAAEVSLRRAGEVSWVRALWRRPNGLHIIGEVALAPGDAGPRFRLTVRNTSGEAAVDTIRMPMLHGIELDDPADDWITWPHTLGARFRVMGFEPGEALQHAYPDFMYMQWLDLHDSEQGIYLGCLDGYGYSKELFIGRHKDGGSLMGIEFVGCWIAQRGDEWTTPWVQLAPHEGDWRTGADLYRAFAQAAFGPLDPPERVREMPTAQCWLAHHACDGDLGKLFEIQQQAPIHASYLMKSLNTSIPEGWDGMRGSGLDYERAFSRVAELGGSPALFTFDRAPLMGRPNYAEHAGRWTSQRRDHSFAEGFRDMMPSPFDPDYVRARVAEAVRWVQAFGIDEIHFDTAATTGPGLAGPSYHPDTPQRPNEVPHYLKALYRAVRDACREENPEFLLRAEHCADFFYPEFLTSTAHFFLTGTLVATHNPPADAQLMPILFRYTLPQHAALQMPSMSDSDFWTHGYGMGYGFHGGGPSWCFNPGVREAESPPGELLHRHRFYDAEWRKYYDFRVGFAEATLTGTGSDVVAEALLGGEWRPCAFPGPVMAATHFGKRLEVTLGQWYHLSHTRYFGKRFVGDDRLDPHPVRLRIPTLLTDPWVRVWDRSGEADWPVRVRDNMVEVEVEDPTCFAVEVAEGPRVDLDCPDLIHPGRTAEFELRVHQVTPAAGEITLILPPGWRQVAPVAVPAAESFRHRIPVTVPEGIFGRFYPIKAVLRSHGLQRICARHVLVMEALTVLYGFDCLAADAPAHLHCVDPGQPARLKVTCVNNTPADAEVTVTVSGEGISRQESRQLGGTPASDLIHGDSPLRLWTDGKGKRPGNACEVALDYQCPGVPSRPVHIEVAMGGEVVFDTDAWPRTRLMDLNGQWKVHLERRSRAKVGGAERCDNLDTEAVTPDVWDGDWPTYTTPIRLDEQTRKDNSWAIYRRSIYLPEAWRGADIQLRLSRTGAPWGLGGTLNLVYVNGWPAGRIGTGGECSLSSFLVFGGWNLLAVASSSPNSLVDPYLFVREAPDPARLKPAEASPRPDGAFILLRRRPTGQGLRLVFIQGVAERDHRRTDIAKGGENTFIYFAIADEFLREPDGPVEIEIEYFDEGTAPFGIAYDSTDASAPVDGAFKDAPACVRTGTDQWKTHVFRLTDARLANREHQGADFRLWAQGDDVRVRRVEVAAVGE